MDPRPPNIVEDTIKDKRRYEDLGHQYKCYKEHIIDKEFPEATLEEILTTIFCDTDHAHDLVTGRSITGLLGIVGSTPVYWKSR